MLQREYCPILPSSSRASQLRRCYLRCAGITSKCSALCLCLCRPSCRPSSPSQAAPHFWRSRIACEACSHVVCLSYAVALTDHVFAPCMHAFSTLLPASSPYRLPERVPPSELWLGQPPTPNSFSARRRTADEKRVRVRAAGAQMEQHLVCADI